jgi:RNA polymerase sigma-54 factor
VAELGVQLEQRADARPTAAQLLLARLLALPATELGAAVADAAHANPALELADRPRCGTCGRLLRGRRCRWCAPAISPPAAWNQPEHPREALKADLRLALDAPDHALAERVVDELDDRGLLGRSPEELAGELGVDPSRLDTVLRVLRRVAPPGVGAVDARESLLVQLAAWDGDAPPRLTHAVLVHADALVAGGPGRLARQLGAALDEVTAALRFVAEHLSPSPLDLSTPEAAVGAPVDLIVHEAVGGGFAVEVTDRSGYGLRLAASVHQVAADPHAPADARAWAAERVRDARLFLGQLDRRSRAVRRVAQATIEHQAEFIRRGPGAHCPLTRAEIARLTGLHESTVSRAVSGKRVRLPDSRTVAFDTFFGTAVAVKAALAELLAEPVRRSDAHLAAELDRRGHHVARRTVAKYRQELAHSH